MGGGKGPSPPDAWWKQGFGFWLLMLLFLWFPHFKCGCSWWIYVSVSSAFGHSHVVLRLGL